MQTRHLPALTERGETGPMKFGGDWTGVFIRGDEALGLALRLETEPEGVLSELVELLRSAAE